MYARMVAGFVPPERLAEVIKLWREEVLPSVQQQNGFRAVRSLADRQSGGRLSAGLT